MNENASSYAACCVWSEKVLYLSVPNELTT